MRETASHCDAEEGSKAADVYKVSLSVEMFINVSSWLVLDKPTCARVKTVHHCVRV